MDDIAKRLRNSAYNTSILKETSIQEMVDEAAYLKLLVTENQLKMLIVLLENIDDLSKQCLLDLSNEERQHISELYETANNCINNWNAESKSNKYRSQIAYISKKRREDNGSTTG